MSEPNYVVIRDPDYPSLSGKWFDLERYRIDGAVDRVGIEREATGLSVEVVNYVPTAFIEVRADGAVAQVYMREK